MYGGDFGSGGDSFAPVQVGEEVDVRIEAVGEKGDGIARKKGFVLFVPSTKEGDEVRIRITKVLRKVGFAEVVGKAQGPVTEDAPPPAREEVAPANIPEPEPAPEDSEDFGEEPVSEPEAPAEEPEAPAEEPEAPVEEPAPEPEMEVPPAPEAPVEEPKEE